MLNRKTLQNNILKALYAVEGVISVTLVGSFAEGSQKEGFSDIDTVVICRDLNETVFKKCLKACESLVGILDRKLLINSTFGPLKFDTNDNIVIHLMVYDVLGHIQHVNRSPFTCYDWERSNKYIGKKLKDICAVGLLVLDDFKKSRRGVQEYETELNKDILSYREYTWHNLRPTEIVKHQPLDDRGKAEFVFHIVKNLIHNFYKLKSGKNNIPSRREVKEIIDRIIPNDPNFLIEFEKLKNLKKENELKISNAIKNWALLFISCFEQYVNTEEANAINVTFIRHAKTAKNDGQFLGIRNDPSILEYDYKFDREFDIIFTSPLKRAFETAQLLTDRQKIITNPFLLEIDYGDADGMKIDEFSNKYPDIIDAWSKNLDPAFPSGENYEGVLSRIDDFANMLLDYTKKDVEIKKVAVITHNVLLRCLIGKMMKFPMHLWYLIEIPHCSQLHFQIWQGKLMPRIDRNYFINLHLGNIARL